MKSWRRTALIVVLSAALGIGAVGWYDRNVAGGRAAATAGSQTAATAPPTPGAPSGRYSNGTYTGRTAYAFYGYVQVKAVVSGGRLQKVVLVRLPNHSGTSRYINSIAGPYLASEAVAAQSGQVNLISGATLTSQAFIESLDSALTQAG